MLAHKVVNRGDESGRIAQGRENEMNPVHIQQFSPNGTFRKAFGRTGSGIGEFSLPAGIAISSRDVITVVDTQNHRIQVFTPASAATEEQR